MEIHRALSIITNSAVTVREFSMKTFSPKISIQRSLILAPLALIFVNSPLIADEVDIGALVARCSECHTEKGLAGIPGWPAIAGMDKDIIVAKLKGHRAGLVNDSTMKKVAHDLTDKEIEAVAEHFAGMLPPEN